jgi:Tfp pilus assembly protein PilO
MKFGIREIVFTVLLAAIPVGAWWFVFRPGKTGNAEALSAIENRQAKLRTLNQATATVGDLKVEIAALEDAVKFFRSKLPSEKEIDKVLQEVWRLAASNRLRTESIRTLKASEETMLTEASGPYAEQPILVKLEGPFNGFYSFLLALETQPRIMRIQQMKLDRSLKGEEGSVRAECTMSVFFERAGKE